MGGDEVAVGKGGFPLRPLFDWYLCLEGLAQFGCCVTLGMRLFCGERERLQ